MKRLKDEGFHTESLLIITGTMGAGKSAVLAEPRISLPNVKLSTPQSTWMRSVSLIFLQQHVATA